MEFMINGDTKVESKLKAGSQAKAEYRFADGRNVAVHVVVTLTSEISARGKDETRDSRAGLWPT